MNKIMKFIKNNKKKLIIFFVVIVIIITTAIIILNTNNKQISKKHRVKIFANTSEGIIKEENYNGLVFNNISLITENGYTTFSVDVTNTNAEVSNVSDVNINFYDKNDNLKMTFRGNIGDHLQPNETRTITSSTKGTLDGVTYKTITEYTQE